MNNEKNVDLTEQVTEINTEYCNDISLSENEKVVKEKVKQNPLVSDGFFKMTEEEIKSTNLD